jgi:hypothetical protein
MSKEYSVDSVMKKLLKTDKEFKMKPVSSLHIIQFVKLLLEKGLLKPDDLTMVGDLFDQSKNFLTVVMNDNSDLLDYSDLPNPFLIQDT